MTATTAPRPVVNPATGETVAEYADTDATDVAAAIETARDGQRRWVGLGPAARADILRALARAVADAADELARLDTDDTGKLLSSARREAAVAARVPDWWAGRTEEPPGTLLAAGAGALDYTVREPVGVVGIILPWNAPTSMALSRISPALALGNSVVLKPSELSPRSALRIAGLAREAGVPDGVLNVVTGGGPTGAALASSPRIGAISFTGSVGGGQAVAAAAAPHFTQLALELGGKSAVVVFPDADLDAAAQAVAAGAMMNSGQVCVAGTRLIAHRRVAAELSERIAANFAAVVVGDPLDAASQMGPLVSLGQHDRVRALVEGAIGAGARLVTGGASLEAPFFPPTLLTDVAPDAEIVQNEVFGPVLVSQVFDSQEEAWELANGTRYGLASYVWTTDLRTTTEAAARLESGTVWINSGPARTPHAVGGGWKASGTGGNFGEQAVAAYTRLKRVAIAAGASR